MLLLCITASNAIADTYGAEFQPRWTNEGEAPGLKIEGAHAGQTVSILFRVSFGPTTVTWNVGPVVVDGPDSPVPVLVPVDAWTNPLQAAYVTDIVAFVTIDGRAEVSEAGFLSWVNGDVHFPVVWNAAQLVVEAPQGVLDPAKRMANVPDTDRINPPCEGEPAAPQNGERSDQ